MLDHLPQTRSSKTHHYDVSYDHSSQYGLRKRNEHPPPPPSETWQPERQIRTYHEQHLSHHLPIVRSHFAYKPALSGKAAEILGVDDVKEFEHNFGEAIEKRKKARMWGSRKFRVDKKYAKRTKVKRTVSIERVRTIPRADSAIVMPEEPSKSRWSVDEEQITKFWTHKKEMGVKEAGLKDVGVKERKRSTRCTIMPSVSRFGAATHQFRRYSALEAISTALKSWTARRQDYHEIDEFEMNSEEGFSCATLEDVEESDTEL